jgi:glycosyltransferase involved in cell wall biosynthesis
MRTTAPDGLLSEIHISVALVTRHRPESLARTLRSLRAQEVQPWEILISDDSDEAQAPAHRQLAQEFQCRYVPGPRRGLYANRNFAAQHCAGTHVRTMDDDHEFPPGHWGAVERAVAQDPDAAWTIGEYYSWPEARLPAPRCGEIQPRGFSLPPASDENSMAVSDGATIYPARVLQQHRMIECFPFGKSYLEFGARLRASGVRLRHVPDTFILHHLHEMGRSYEAGVLDVQTGFLAAALAYGVYAPSVTKSLECWIYFTALAVRNHLSARKNVFALREWKEAAALFFKFRRAYRQQLPFDSVRVHP